MPKQVSRRADVTCAVPAKNGVRERPRSPEERRAVYARAIEERVFMLVARGVVSNLDSLIRVRVFTNDRVVSGQWRPQLAILHGTCGFKIPYLRLHHVRKLHACGYRDTILEQDVQICGVSAVTCVLNGGARDITILDSR